MNDRNDAKERSGDAKRYDVILFDLDGTITESHIGIIRSVKYALEKYGIREEDEEKLMTFIGPPMKESLKKHYGFTGEKLEEAIAYYREYFVERGIFENTLYPDIEKVLRTLKARGKTLLVATSKAEPYAVQILKYFGLDLYFDLICGASMDGSLCEKTDVIRYTLQRYAQLRGIDPEQADRSRFVMIGDRYYDVTGAQDSGCDSVGVLYGYGDREELESYGATHIAETPLSLLRILP